MDITTALAVLTDAVDRCRNEDMRTPDVFAALDFLEAVVTLKWPFDQFRKSLDSTNEEGRWQTLNASLNAVRRAVANTRAAGKLYKVNASISDNRLYHGPPKPSNPLPNWRKLHHVDLTLCIEHLLKSQR